MPKIELNLPSDNLKMKFMKFFIADLENVGYKVSSSYKVLEDSKKIQKNITGDLFDAFKRINTEYQTDQYYGMNFEISAQDSFVLSKRKSREIYHNLKIKRISESQDFLKICKDLELNNLFLSGSDIDFDKIDPELVIIKRKTRDNLTEEEKVEHDYYNQVFDYLRLLQGIPSEDPPFRKIKALVFDRGQENKKLIGGICLSGTNYYMKVRDLHLEWDSIDSKSRKKKLREKGLKSILQLSFCMAVPPYNLIRGCKLLNSLVFCSELQDEYHARYGDYYSGVVATSALRANSPIYEGISFKNIDSKLTTDAYKYIGKTQGTNVLFISNDTYSIAKKLVANSNYSYKNKNRRISKKQVILYALRICNISVKILDVKEIGIYFGTKSEEDLVRLKTGKDIDLSNQIDAASVIENWKNLYMSQAIQDEKVLEKVQKMNIDENIMWEVSNE